MVSFGSAYDRGRLDAEAREGREVFARDCAGCHAGPLFTDRAYHRFAAAAPAAADQGLSETSGRPDDVGRFHTPSLRNVMLTGPWWHDGTARSLGEVIARHGLRASREDEARLFAFLSALSDTEFTVRPSLSMPETACGKRL